MRGEERSGSITAGSMHTASMQPWRSRHFNPENAAGVAGGIFAFKQNFFLNFHE